MSKHTILLSLYLTAIQIMAAQNVFLNGTVRDADDNPIAEAVVKLASDSTLRDTTNSNGEFSIINTTPVFKNCNNRISFLNIKNISIKDNQLQFFINSNAKNGVIDIFSGIGKKNVSIQTGKMESGIHNVALPMMAPGIYLMNVTINQSFFCLKILNTGNQSFVNKYETKNSYILSLNAAMENTVDTLIVKKKWF